MRQKIIRFILRPKYNYELNDNFFFTSKLIKLLVKSLLGTKNVSSKKLFSSLIIKIVTITYVELRGSTVSPRIITVISVITIGLPCLLKNPDMYGNNMVARIFAQM